MYAHASMNKVYRIIWNATLGVWQVVGELGKGAGKGTSDRRKHRHHAVAVLAAGALASYSAQLSANPTGMGVVSGTATAVQQGNVLSITNSQNAILNWQQFNIQANETTKFIQPSVDSAVLNRVLSNSPSEIMGHLQSNGSVYLINQAGILVGKDSMIDVAGFTASTLNLSDDHFKQGILNFQANPQLAGSVTNQGSIRTPDGGQVLLIGSTVTNQGKIETPNGVTLLAAGSEVLIGDTATPGVQVAVKISGEGQAQNIGQILATAGKVGIVGAAVQQSGIVSADNVVNEGGRILLKATKSLSNTGTVSANGDTKGGQVVLSGDEITNAGKITATGKTSGGEILVGGDWQGSNANKFPQATKTTLTSTSQLDVSATETGNGGKVVVYSGLDKANGKTIVDGVIKAESKGANTQGGKVETSGHALQVKNTTQVRTRGGLWLLDPTDITIESTGSTSDLTGASISGTFLGSSLASNSITLTATNDITVNDAVTWSAATKLTLGATNNIHINAPITASHANGQVELSYGGSYDFGLTSSGFAGSINLQAGQNFIENANVYTVVTSLGVAGDTSTSTLQGMTYNVSGNSSARYVLGANIDASATSTWNVGQGFDPIYNFYGRFDGLGHTISNLYINRPTYSNVGLFAQTYSGSVVRNVALSNVNIMGNSQVGGLVGYNDSGNISNILVSGSVTANYDYVGGVIGNNFRSVWSNLFSSATVSSINNAQNVGSLVGYNQLQDTSYSYNGQNQLPTASSLFGHSDWVLGTDYTITDNAGASIVNIANVGTYSVKVNVLKAGYTSLSGYAMLNITQRDAVTWNGATTGDWFTATNWKYTIDGTNWITTGLLPSGNNVANVYIPTGTTVTYNATSQTPVMGLNYVGGLDANNVQIKGGTLNITGGQFDIYGSMRLTALNLSGTGSDAGRVIGNASIYVDTFSQASIDNTVRATLLSVPSLSVVANIYSDSNNLTLVTDNLTFATNTQLISNSPNGQLNIYPYTASTSIGAGSGAGTLQLPASYFNTNVSGFSSIIVGGTNTANIDISGTGTGYAFTTNSAVTFKSSGNITLPGQLDWTGSSGLSLISGGTLALNGSLVASSGSISLTANTLTLGGSTVSGTGQLSIQPYTLDASIGIAGGAGTLVLPASYFSTNFVNGFSTIVIGDISTGDITVGGAVTYNDSLTLISKSSIFVNANMAGTSGELASLALMSAANSDMSGTIRVADNVLLTTNGGNLTLGGGGGYDGYAHGVSDSLPEGVYLGTGSQLLSGGGSISIKGSSFAGANGGIIYSGVSAHGTIDSGTGTILIDGVALGTGNAQGVTTDTGNIISASASSYNINGIDAIRITGSFNGGATAETAMGANLAGGGSSIYTTNGGSISIYGSGGDGTSGFSHGVYYSGNLLSNSGNIRIKGYSPVANKAIELAATAVIGQKAGSAVTSSSSNIWLDANDLTLSSAVLQSSGALSISPYTSSSTTIGIAGGAGTLVLPASYFSTNFVGFSQIKIGDYNSGDITLGGAMSFAVPISLTSTGIIKSADATAVLTAKDITINAGQIGSTTISGGVGTPTDWLYLTHTGTLATELVRLNTMGMAGATGSIAVSFTNAIDTSKMTISTPTGAADSVYLKTTTTADPGITISSNLYLPSDIVTLDTTQTIVKNSDWTVGSYRIVNSPTTTLEVSLTNYWFQWFGGTDSNWYTASNWKYSSDGTSWITSTYVPVGNVLGVYIPTSYTVTYNSTGQTAISDLPYIGGLSNSIGGGLNITGGTFGFAHNPTINLATLAQTSGSTITVNGDLNLPNTLMMSGDINIQTSMINDMSKGLLLGTLNHTGAGSVSLTSARIGSEATPLSLNVADKNSTIHLATTGYNITDGTDNTASAYVNIINPTIDTVSQTFNTANLTIQTVANAADKVKVSVVGDANINGAFVDTTGDDNNHDFVFLDSQTGSVSFSGNITLNHEFNVVANHGGVTFESGSNLTMTAGSLYVQGTSTDAIKPGVYLNQATISATGSGQSIDLMGVSSNTVAALAMFGGSVENVNGDIALIALNTLPADVTTVPATSTFAPLVVAGNLSASQVNLLGSTVTQSITFPTQAPSDASTTFTGWMNTQALNVRSSDGITLDSTGNAITGVELINYKDSGSAGGNIALVTSQSLGNFHRTYYDSISKTMVTEPYLSSSYIDHHGSSGSTVSVIAPQIDGLTINKVDGVVYRFSTNTTACEACTYAGNIYLNVQKATFDANKNPIYADVDTSNISFITPADSSNMISVNGRVGNNGTFTIKDVDVVTGNTLADNINFYTFGDMAVMSNLVVSGTIRAATIGIGAMNGSIQQTSGSLIADVLWADANTGISLGSTTLRNTIANAWLYNRTSGNVSFYNQKPTSYLADASEMSISVIGDNTAKAGDSVSRTFVSVNQIPETVVGANGTDTITIDNIGALVIGGVNANGSVSLAAHSPLTIEGQITSSTGSVTLVADNSGVLTINAPVNASNGSISMTSGGDPVLGSGATLTTKTGNVSVNGTTLSTSLEPTPTPAPTPTEPVTEAPTETPTEPVTEAPTEAPTEPVTEAPTEVPTEPVTEAPTTIPTPTTPDEVEAAVQEAVASSPEAASAISSVTTTTASAAASTGSSSSSSSSSSAAAIAISAPSTGGGSSGGSPSLGNQSAGGEAGSFGGGDSGGDSGGGDSGGDSGESSSGSGGKSGDKKSDKKSAKGGAEGKSDKKKEDKPAPACK